MLTPRSATCILGAGVLTPKEPTPNNSRTRTYSMQATDHVGGVHVDTWLKLCTESTSESTPTRWGRDRVDFHLAFVRLKHLVLLKEILLLVCTPMVKSCYNMFNGFKYPFGEYVLLFPGSLSKSKNMLVGSDVNSSSNIPPSLQSLESDFNGSQFRFWVLISLRHCCCGASPNSAARSTLSKGGVV